MKDNTSLRNVGLIMDGNGRWAQMKNQPRLSGHTQGIENMITLIAHAFDCGVENIVCYGLSTENLFRAKEEIGHIYELMLDIYDRFVKMMKEKKAYVKYVGNTHLLPSTVQASMKRVEEELKEFKDSGRTAYIGIVYGSKNEIVNAVNRAVEKGETVDEDKFLSSLDVPINLDLIIRTGGEHRLSNFVLYQASYAELYFSDKFFPEYSPEDMSEAFEWYAGRKRRFGLVK